MTLCRLNHVGVATPLIAASIETYRTLLGATAIGEPFDLPAQELKVCFIDELIQPHSTRPRVALELRKLRGKRLENAWKKHEIFRCEVIC